MASCMRSASLCSPATNRHLLLPLRTHARRRAGTCRAQDDDRVAPWQPVLNFFGRKDVKLSDLTRVMNKSEAYQKYLKDFIEGPVGSKSYGWKEIPELVNGRAAMMGFVAAACAELLGAGSVLQQSAAAPQSVMVLLGLIMISTLVPIVKGTKGDYLESLRDTYPKDLFTPELELVHGRIAMLGLTSIMLIELFIGRALL